jgi:hypothetical protein
VPDVPCHREGTIEHLNRCKCFIWIFYAILEKGWELMGKAHTGVNGLGMLVRCVDWAVLPLLHCTYVHTAVWVIAALLSTGLADAAQGYRFTKIADTSQDFRSISLFPAITTFHRITWWNVSSLIESLQR